VPAANHCRNADRALYAARQIRQSNPQIAAAEYKKAAAAARQAGDNSLELSILREAMEPATAVIAAVTASAPAAATATMPPQQTAADVPRMWDGSREKCGHANRLEMNTAGWVVMCGDPPPPKSSHRPNPDPPELSKRARQACGSYSRDTQQCFADFKLKAILASNPGFHDACERADRNSLRRQLSERLNPGQSGNRERYFECVDNLYLYGSIGGPPLPKNSLRESLRKRLNATGSEEPKYVAGGNAKSHLCWSPGRCCPPGHGLKDTLGAFGAKSCQPLGLLALNTTQPRLASKEKADLIEHFEDRVNESVAKAVAAALDAVGPALSERDRDICAAVSFAAVHAMLKGGAPDVPEPCRAMASGARGYFARYAEGHVDNSNSAMDDLLASFQLNVGAPLPGMTGLTPDEDARRTGECLLRGGRAETCN
jgi:hypothetical protein